MGYLVKKVDYKTNIVKIKKDILNNDHDKYISTQEFNKLKSENLDAKLKQANLVSNVILLIL